MRILVVSDLHLGNGSKSDDFGYGRETFEREARFLEFVESQNPDRVYLNGDIYELWQARWKKIKKAHEKLVKVFENDPKYIYIVGNHDFNLTGLYSDEIRTKSGKRVIIAHGFTADPWMNNVFTRTLIWFIGGLERLISPNIDLWPHMLRRSGEKSILKKRQTKYAEKLLKTYDICILGHTHYLDIDTNDVGRIYANTGTCQTGKLQGILLDTETDEIRIVEG
ncbi:MAG: metallophosphoesterase family protein [Candidatus Lokiarchaeota archaeon]|nr:metallophosphoesterase family protein [Candidatus Lokiarchaeota archaeon]